MSDKDDGGPAFPLNTPEWHERLNVDGYRACDFTMGMSMCDYFAAKAMQAAISSKRDEQMRGYTDWLQEFAAEAYRYADAMLKERSK